MHINRDILTISSPQEEEDSSKDKLLALRQFPVISMYSHAPIYSDLLKCTLYVFTSGENDTALSSLLVTKRGEVLLRLLLIDIYIKD